MPALDVPLRYLRYLHIGQDSRRVLTRTVGEYLSGVDPVFSITVLVSTLLGSWPMLARNFRPSLRLRFLLVCTLVYWRSHWLREVLAPTVASTRPRDQQAASGSSCSPHATGSLGITEGAVPELWFLQERLLSMVLE